MNLPLGRKRDRFGKVLTCPHDRAANGDALQHNIEDWCCEFAWRKANEAYGPTAPRETQRLRKCGRRHSRHEHAMRTTPGCLQHLRRRIG